jgi:hypothetical protein
MTNLSDVQCRGGAARFDPRGRHNRDGVQDGAANIVGR